MQQPNHGLVAFDVLLSDLIRLDVEIDYRRGKVTDISLQLMGWVDGAWAELVRYDNAHGPFHRHLFHPGGADDIYNFPTSIHPNTIAARAHDDLREHAQSYYDEYVRRNTNLKNRRGPTA